MTLAAYINERYLGDAATHSGWAKLAEHIRLTSVRDFPNAHHLVDFGWSRFIFELREELRRIASQHPPSLPAVVKTLKELIDTLPQTKANPDDVLVISDGLA